MHSKFIGVTGTQDYLQRCIDRIYPLIHFNFRYEKFNKVKEEQPGLKTLLAVGGWNFGTTKMSNMLRTKQV